jgi:hypothetical protein
MVVREDESRRAAIERTLEKSAVGQAMRIPRAAADHLVAEECAAPVEIDEEQHLFLEASKEEQKARRETRRERDEKLARLYQTFQAGSLP